MQATQSDDQGYDHISGNKLITQQDKEKGSWYEATEYFEVHQWGGGEGGWQGHNHLSQAEKSVAITDSG